jgi:hypothetical protein
VLELFLAPKEEGIAAALNGRRCRCDELILRALVTRGDKLLCGHDGDASTRGRGEMELDALFISSVFRTHPIAEGK